MTRKSVVTDRAGPQPVGAYSPAIRLHAPIGDLLFVSGLTSRGPDGHVIGENDVGLQTETVLENLRTILAAAGCTLSDVVKVTVFVRDMGHFARVHEVRRRYFSPPYPASSMVEVSRLVDPRSLIEIEAIAVVP